MTSVNGSAQQSTIHEAVAVWARTRAGHVAVSDATRTLTFSELDRYSTGIAARLRERGVRPGDLVGVYLDRSVDLVAGVLGVLKTGAGYVPLDPEFPADRLAFMVADANIEVVLTEHSLRSSAPGKTRVEVGEATKDDRGVEALPSVEPGAVAYVIYTSGSTGTPKGVMVSHRSVVNLLSSMAEEPGFTSADTWLAVTTLSFDISVLELFGPLLAGGTTAVASRDEVLDGTGLLKALERSRATIMQATPVAWRMLLESGWEGDRNLKALCGGEALPQDLAQTLLGRVGSLWNVYGPTETTIWSTCFQVMDATKPILIGHPVAETTIYVLDKAMRQQPTGIPGEIFIGGTGVALGYHNRPDLTSARFLADPFSQEPGARMYRTGDIGRYLRDGNLEYRGRADNQVKIRGFRVELGEIESALAASEGVRQAVVVVHRGAAGDDRLVAFLVAEGVMPEPEALRSRLGDRLPRYMIPHHYVQVEAYPTTPNGKVDRKALTEGIGALPRTEAPYVAPRTETETEVAAILADVLGLERVGVDANFFDLGGHSVLAMRVVARLRLTAPGIAFRDIFQTPTVAGLAARMDELRGPPAGTSPAASESEEREQVVI
jgi:amino acid adenylation domain-containing protein